jgi:xanthosine utilization system XapX-like protein
MAAGRVLRSLHIYDILANLLPGSMLLVVIIATVRVEEYLGGLSSGVFVAAFLVVGFIAGHIIQAFASRLNGKPRLFGLLVADMRGIDPYDPNGTFEFLPSRLRSWLGFERSTLSDLHVTEVEREFWPLAKNQFDLTDELEHHGRLMQLVLSYLESGSATRALRFQSIHTFHRSMWGMWFVSLIFVAGVWTGSLWSLVPVRSTAILGLIFMLSLVGIWTFGKRKEKFNRKVVEYTIIDFYTQQKSQ